MELVKIIFEKYGGQQISRIFQNYFTLTLLLKHLIFSFFILSADPPAVEFIPEESSHTISNKVETEFSGEELNRFEVLQLMLTLAQIEIEREVVLKENSIQNSKIPNP